MKDLIQFKIKESSYNAKQGERLEQNEPTGGLGRIAQMSFQDIRMWPRNLKVI